MTKNTNITDRASWLSFRADWRLRYKATSEEIRRLKRELVATYAERRLLAEEKERERVDWKASSLQGTLHHARRNAYWLMVELDEAKETKAQLLAERAERKAA